ncbi:MAG: hypothetical protein ACP5N3_05545 [Candidatus Nanoarchaeia archaeon]
MALQDPLFFLGLCVITFIGFVLRALVKYNPESDTIFDNPMIKSVGQIIFLTVLTILWLLLMFK